MPQDEFYFESSAFNFKPTTKLDAESDAPSFLGEDLALWLIDKLKPVWQTTFGQEDWGWYVEASQEGHKYLIGVYDLRNCDDPETELPEEGQWCLRLFNLVDNRPLLKRLFSRQAVPIDETVASEIHQLLQSASEIRGLREAL